MLRYAAIVAISSIGLLTLPAACGSSDAQTSSAAGGGSGGEGGGATDVDALRTLYATAVCANIVPCCHDVGQDVTQATCVAAVSSQFGAIDFAFGALDVPAFPVPLSGSAVDPQAAAKCVEAAAAAVSACPLSYAAAAQASIDTLVACQSVYAGHDPLGARCVHAGDCAPAQGAGAVNACVASTCSTLAFRVADLGDDCDATFDTCNVDAALTCSATGTCTAGLAVGALCCQPQAGGVECNSDTELPCAAGAFCDANIQDATFGYCTTGTQVGDPCHGTGSCDAPQGCVGGACVAPKKGGEACTEGDTCTGGSCQLGTCVSDFANSLWVQFCR
ncbi:MAG TPA: hypothetical protein VGM56_24400 [Byssovorax sp.]|jgi:hypothetical protein